METNVKVEVTIEQDLKIKKRSEETGRSRSEIIADAIDLFLLSMGF